MEAGHTTTINTNEMGVLASIRVRHVTDLESPDVIPEFPACCQACLDQIGEVTEHRRFVETKRNQIGRNFRMCCWRRGPLQPVHHRQSRCCRSQSAVRKKFPRLANGVNVYVLSHIQPFLRLTHLLEGQGREDTKGYLQQTAKGNSQPIPRQSLLSRKRPTSVSVAEKPSGPPGWLRPVYQLRRACCKRPDLRELTTSGHTGHAGASCNDVPPE